MRQFLFLVLFILPIFGIRAFALDSKEKIKEFISIQKYQEAFIELQTMEKKEPFDSKKNPELLWLKAYLEYELGKKDEAKADLEIAIKTDSWRSESAYYLALIEASDNNYKKSLELLNLAEKNKINHTFKLKIQIARAKSLVFAKKWKEASVYLKKTEKFFRGDASYPEMLKLMVRVNLELNNYRGACKIVEKIYKKFPTDIIFSKNLPFIEKVEILESRISCPVDDDLFSSHRRALFALGQVDLVNQEIDTWIERYHLNGYEKDLLITHKTVNVGDFTLALDILLKYYEEKKNQKSYLALLSSIAARAGNFSLSIGVNYRIYQLPGSKSKKRNVLFQAAMYSFQIQDYDGAQSKFEEYIKSFSRSRNTNEARWYIAWIQYLKGHYKESSELMTSLSKGDKRRRKSNIYNERIQYWLAMSLFKTGDVPKAKSLFVKLINRSSENSFYAIAAQQRIKKINNLNINSPIPIANEHKSMLKFAFKMVFVNAQSFPTSYIPFENLDSGDNPNDDRSIASTVEDGDIVGSDSEVDGDSEVDSDDPADEGQSEIVDGETQETEVPDNLNSVKSAELQAKIDKARFLTAWGFEDWGRSEYNDIEHYIVKNEKNKSVLEDYQKLKDYFRLSTLSHNVWSRRGTPDLDLASRYLWESMYPLAYREEIKRWADDFNLPQALVWGVMRAESQYRPWVVSPVGAQGLMQIMPFTGKKVSELLGENDFSVYSLKDPSTAIKIGSKYLERMSNNFHSSIPLIAAAYNAGPHRVQNWVYNFGYLEMDEWIEHIPFSETRNYVKKVTSNYFTYLNLYGDAIKSKKLSLVDLVPVQISEPMPLIEKWD